MVDSKSTSETNSYNPMAKKWYLKIRRRK